MASSAGTMAFQTHLFSRTHRRLLHPIQHKHSPIHFHRPPSPSSSSSSLFANKTHSVSVTRRHTNPPTLAAISTQTNTEQTPASASASSKELLEGSTRTVTTLLGMALLFLRAFQKLPSLLSFNSVSASAVGPLFFASLKDRPSGYLNTPLTVVAAGLGKWLDIYSGVLMVRVLLSWFPNIPWERQPLSAIRDLCDPYLNLFRNIIPPVFDTLDVSPLLAFAVLGTLGSILHTAMT